MFMINYEQVYGSDPGSGQPKNTPLNLPEKVSEDLPNNIDETAESGNNFCDITPEELLAKISDTASSVSKIASDVSSQIKNVLNSDEAQAIIQATKDKASAGFDILKDKTVKAAENAKTGAQFIKETVETTASDLKEKKDRSVIDIKEKFLLTKEKAAEKISLLKEKTERAADSDKTEVQFENNSPEAKTDNTGDELPKKVSLTKKKDSGKISLLKEPKKPSEDAKPTALSENDSAKATADDIYNTENKTSNNISLTKDNTAENTGLLKEISVQSAVNTDERSQPVTKAVKASYEDSNKASDNNIKSTEYHAEKKHFFKPASFIFPCLMSTALILSGVVFILILNKNRNEIKENPNINETDGIANMSSIESEQEEKTSDNTVSLVHYDMTIHDTGFSAGNKAELYANMTQILQNNKDFVSPATCSALELNNSGNEMFIVPDAVNECFDLYLNRDGRICSIKFGKFSSISEIQFFKVSDANTENKNYIYYCCNYAHKSVNGYYDPVTGNQIRTEISYIDDSENSTAEWKIYKICNSNETEVCSGKESSYEMYKTPVNCNKSLYELFSSMNVKITDKSQYEAVERLSPDETFNYLKNVSLVTTAESTTTATEPPPPVVNEELGKIYNEYFFFVLTFYGPGWIEDADNDGVDNFVYIYDNLTYVCSYENGEIVKNHKPGYLPKSKQLSKEEYISIYRQKAFDNGFDLNYNFHNETVYFGKIKTQGGHLNLRNAPSMEGGIITELPNSLFINIYGIYDRNGFYMNSPYESFQQAGWYEISVSYNGQLLSGYVSADYVRFFDSSI